MRFLGPKAALCHIEAVGLLWKMQQRSGGCLLETVISETLVIDTGRRSEMAWDQFGILWRYTGMNHSLYPVRRYKDHVRCVHHPCWDVAHTFDAHSYFPIELGTTIAPGCGDLATRISEVTHNVRAVYLGHYYVSCLTRLRLIETLMLELLDPKMRIKTVISQIEERSFQRRFYAGLEDFRQYSHILGVLMAFVRFAGTSLSKAMEGITVHGATDPRLFSRAQAGQQQLNVSTAN